MLAEVSGKLITQFADCLASEITSDGPRTDGGAADPAASSGNESDAAPTAASDDQAPAVAPTPDREARPSPEAIDLLDTAGGPVLKRIAPLLAVAAAVVVAILLIRRSR